MPRFDFPQFLSYNAKYRITFFFTVPPIYLLIAKSPLATTQFKTLEIAISGAAPLGKDLQYAASQKLGDSDCFIDQTWGLSETTGSTTIMPPGTHDDTGSVAPLIPNMRARLVDDAGNDVDPGKPGEVLVKGPVVCKGYYQNSDADREAFTPDGWFRTGDIAVFRNGLFYVVDRKKELIKYKGLQVRNHMYNSHVRRKTDSLHQYSRSRLRNWKLCCSVILIYWMRRLLGCRRMMGRMRCRERTLLLGTEGRLGRKAL
jgi:4-coumarate--CoA ligase